MTPLDGPSRIAHYRIARINSLLCVLYIDADGREILRSSSFRSMSLAKAAVEEIKQQNRRGRVVRHHARNGGAYFTIVTAGRRAVSAKSVTFPNVEERDIAIASLQQDGASAPVFVF